MSIIDSMSNIVKDITGETERRQILQNFKDMYSDKKNQISEILSRINNKVNVFNDNILKLNTVRQKQVGEDLMTMSNFLDQFGNVPSEYKFSRESYMIADTTSGKKELEHIDNYIEQIDFSKEEVFVKAFFRTPIIDMFITRKENEENVARLKSFEMECNAKIQEALTYELFVEEDIRILKEYVMMIKTICTIINQRIIPEMELVNAYLECSAVNDAYISGEPYTSQYKGIVTLLGTKYEKHYIFVKNTFAFFCVARKIYESPVLTNLLAKGEHTEEKKIVEVQKDILQKQIDRIDKCFE